MTTAEKLVSLRKEKGLSQLQLAEEINVSRQAISRWEVGLAVPSREKLRALSELYNVSVDYLLSDKTAEDMQKVSKPEDEAKEKPSNHLRVGLMACVVVILLVVVGVMLLHFITLISRKMKFQFPKWKQKKMMLYFLEIFR